MIPSRALRIGCFSVCLASLNVMEGCSVLKPVKTTETSYYSLDSPGSAKFALPVTVEKLGYKPTLIINPPSASAGFESSRIIYIRQLHKIEYFAHSEWVESPAKMLAPLLSEVLQKSGIFRAVVLTPSAVAADWRLNTEVVRLQHEFLGATSQVRFTLRAHFVDEKTRRVIAIREFDVYSLAPSENPYGGVTAANLIVAAVLRDLVSFSAELAAQAIIPK
jgi:cholesterol transport system auxiliary component